MASAAFWRRGATVAIAAIVALAPLTASGAPDQDDLRVPRETSADRSATWLNARKWLVEFESEPTASGGNLNTIARQQRSFIAEARAAGRPAQVNKNYERLFNGVSVDADAATAELYAELPSVKAVHPVRTVSVPENQSVSPRMLTAIAQTGADIAQNELGLTGEGIKVAIIDTGIDIDHPAFGGSGTDGTTTFPTQRVAYGYDLVGDDYNADPTSDDFQPVPKPDAIPDDCQGHGTHVAGIVGGSSDELTGVAPGVTFGAYRVFGCGGSTDTQIILDALEMAEADGMDVVNMSLGSDFANWPQDPSAKAADRLVRNGIVVVNSAGNAGDMYTMTLGSPGSSDLSINVASFDNSHVLMDEVVFTLADETTVEAGYAPAAGSPEPTDALNGLEVVQTTDPLACEPETEDLTGKVALISRGTCTFNAKAFTAQEAGASAVVIANNAPGFINATVEDGEEITIPVVTVTQAVGAEVAEGLPATVEFTGETTLQPNPTGGLVSTFSSWGLAADLTLQPDVGAPGGSIRSAYPLEKQPYATLSGTSMAAPHTAGAVALMLEADAGLTPAEVRDRLQNSAEPAAISELPDLGFLDAAHRQGAGLIQVDKAIQQPYVVSPGKISAGESADGAHTETLTITNTSDAEVTWTLGHEDALSTYLEFDPNYGDGTQNTAGYNIFESGVAFSADTVTVPAGGTATVDVTITAPEDESEGIIYSGYLTLTTDEGADTVTIPYAGLAGDYADLEIFPEVYGLPSMVEILECDTWFDGQCYDPEVQYDYVDAGHIYEGGADLPTAAFIMNQPVLKLTIDVLKADTDGNPIADSRQTVLSFDHLGRSGWEALYTWNGMLPNEQGLLIEAAPGNYLIEVTGLEADGDGGSQSWTSKVFGWKNMPVEPVPTPTETVTVPAPEPTEDPAEPKDVYNTPGLHEVNGRKWFTACEPYSQTVRCRTMIWGTQISQVGGQFQQRNGWVFNNLTYLPKMTRAEWGANPLANTGSWTSDGRQWRTECDTALTGRGGCRSFITADVIEAKPKAGGGYTYQWVTKEIFNNMVRFKKG